MSEITETLSQATADVATLEPTTNGSKQQKSPKTASTGARDHNLTTIDPKTKLGGGYSDAEKDAMMKLYDQTFNTLKPDQVLMGKVVAITGSEIAVDIGFKSEGMIPRSEFSNTPNLQ